MITDQSSCRAWRRAARVAQKSARAQIIALARVRCPDRPAALGSPVSDGPPVEEVRGRQASESPTVPTQRAQEDGGPVLPSEAVEMQWLQEQSPTIELAPRPPLTRSDEESGSAQRLRQALVRNGDNRAVRSTDQPVTAPPHNSSAREPVAHRRLSGEARPAPKVTTHCVASNDLAQQLSLAENDLVENAASSSASLAQMIETSADEELGTQSIRSDRHTARTVASTASSAMTERHVPAELPGATPALLQLLAVASNNAAGARLQSTALNDFADNKSLQAGQTAAYAVAPEASTPSLDRALEALSTVLGSATHLSRHEGICRAFAKSTAEELLASNALSDELDLA